MKKIFLVSVCLFVSANCLAYVNYIDQAIDANGNQNYRLSNSLLHKAIASGESGQQIILYQALNYYQMRQYKLAQRLFNNAIDQYNLTAKNYQRVQFFLAKINKILAKKSNVASFLSFSRTQDSNPAYDEDDLASNERTPADTANTVALYAQYTYYTPWKIDWFDELITLDWQFSATADTTNYDEYTSANYDYYAANTSLRFNAPNWVSKLSVNYSDENYAESPYKINNKFQASYTFKPALFSVHRSKFVNYTGLYAYYQERHYRDDDLSSSYDGNKTKYAVYTSLFSNSYLDLDFTIQNSSIDRLDQQYAYDETGVSVSLEGHWQSFKANLYYAAASKTYRAENFYMSIRSDDLISFGASLAYRFNYSWQAGVSYDGLENTSNQSNYSYTQDTYSGQIKYFSSMAKILLVEDDYELANLTAAYLQKFNYVVDIVKDGNQAVQKILSANKYEVVLLDIMLPGIDGFEVCKQVRKGGYTGIVLMLTAVADDIDHITGLEIGADDYLIKPVSPRLLLAKIKSQLNRVSSSNDAIEEVMTINGISINPLLRLVSINGAVIHLTDNQYDLLYLLANNAGHIYTRSELLQQLKGDRIRWQ